jgi:hypothetical protein
MAERVVTERVEVALKRQRSVCDTLRLLTPFDLPRERKRRFGTPGDGSYVLVDRLRADQPILSFGVGPSVNLELELAERGHEVLLFDHTVDALPSEHPRFTWYREGVGAPANAEGPLLTLQTHMAKLPWGAGAPILKLDVEGHEWSVLETVPRETLRRFEQIAVELHGLQFLDGAPFRALAQRVLRRLAEDFTICHVHANNFNHLATCSNFTVTASLEVTYIRSDLVERAPSRTFYPTVEDSPNYAVLPDHRLWFFPFLPGSAEAVFEPV